MSKTISLEDVRKNVLMSQGLPVVDVLAVDDVMPLDEPAPGSQDSSAVVVDIPEADRKLMATRRSVIQRATDLAAKHITDPDWLLDGIIPADGITVLGGGIKEGKSYWAQNLAVNVARGTAFLNRTTKQCGVMYVELDHPSEGEWRRRVGIISGGMDQIPDNLLYISPEEGTVFPRLDTQGHDTVDELHALLLEAKYSLGVNVGLIIIDVFAHISSGKSTGMDAYRNGYLETSKLTAWTHDAGIAVVLIHHTHKGHDAENPFNDLSGSNALFATSTAGIVLKKPLGTDTVEMWTRSNRATDDGHYTLTMDGGIFRYKGDAYDACEEKLLRNYKNDPCRRLVTDLVHKCHTVTGSMSSLISMWEGLTGTEFPLSPKKLSVWLNANETTLYNLDEIAFRYTPHGKTYTLYDATEDKTIDIDVDDDEPIDPDQPF